MNDNQDVCWIFNFALESTSGVPVARSVPSALLETIVQWAEDNEMQIGGGYRKPSEQESKSGPIFEIDAEEE